MNGSLAGYVSNAPPEPGVSYQIGNWTDTNLCPPLCSAIAMPMQDPALGEVIQGGAIYDDVLAGGGNDTVSGGAGNDPVYLCDGSDRFGGWAARRQIPFWAVMVMTA